MSPLDDYARIVEARALSGFGGQVARRAALTIDVA